MSKFVWIKKRSIITILICAILAVASFGFWQMNNTTQAAVVDPHPGLVGWWSFNEGNGVVAGDSSGNGNNGTVYGATWVPGRYGSALNLASGNYVAVSDASNLNPSTEFTISFWANVPSFSNWMGIVTKGAGLYNTPAWGIWSTAGAGFRFIVGVGGINYQSTPINPILNSWEHFVFVFNNGVVSTYANGVLVDTTSGFPSSVTNLSGYPLIIGKDGGARFVGSLDEVRLYNRALSSAEIQADFNKGPDFTANVLAKVPQGTTQVITTLSWQGTGNINATIVSPAQNYTENTQPLYQKSSYSTSNGITSMLNIKRLSVSVSALPSNQNWNVVLTLDKVDVYQITVEVQK